MNNVNTIEVRKIPIYITNIEMYYDNNQSTCYFGNPIISLEDGMVTFNQQVIHFKPLDILESFKYARGLENSFIFDDEASLLLKNFIMRV